MTDWRGRLPCQTDQDCQDATNDFGPCGGIGVCSDDPNYLCDIPGLPCLTDVAFAGICLPNTTGVCNDRLVCDAPSCATPAVEIAPLPAAVPALLASIEAQAPNGGTPSGPALSGAIDQAREWANAHPGHTVTVLLATDAARV